MFLAATFVISYDLSFVWSIYFIEKAQVVADNIFAVFSNFLMNQHSAVMAILSSQLPSNEEEDFGKVLLKELSFDL